MTKEMIRYKDVKLYMRGVAKEFGVEINHFIKTANSYAVLHYGEDHGVDVRKMFYTFFGKDLPEIEFW